MGRRCVFVYTEAFLQPLAAPQHIAQQRPPTDISGLLIYYAVSYYIKSLPPFFSSSTSIYLPASGSFPQWEDNLESSQGSFDLPHVFPSFYASVGPKGSLQNLCLRFPVQRF